MLLNELISLMKATGYEIRSITKAKSGSLYINTNKGLIRLSNHPQVVYRARQKAIKVDIRFHMDTNKVKELLLKD
jgi:hypothetical protein